MGFFSKWRKKRKKSQDVSESSLSFMQTEQSDKNTQHIILSCCEQMIEASKELEEEKSEYKVVTDYLNDIQFLEELPESEAAELKNAAEKVQQLNNRRDEYQNTEKKISDVQFVQMQQEEDTIPDAIRRLQTNETYQNTVKKDMKYLEGEKTEWQYNKIDLARQQGILKNLSFVLFGLLVVCFAVFMVVSVGYQKDITYLWLSAILIIAVSAFFIFIKMSSNQTEIKRSEVNINHAIMLLNKLTFKYVNVTNAVDYAREKYHVRNAGELNYIWEQYLNEVREREKYRQMNEDLEYFNKKLIRKLKQYRLYDAEVWIHQSSALVDKKEMVEVKHNLIVRRQKLRSRMEYNMQSIRENRKEIDRLLEKEKIDSPEIREIIDSIDYLEKE